MHNCIKPLLSDSADRRGFPIRANNRVLYFYQEQVENNFVVMVTYGRLFQGDSMLLIISDCTGMEGRSLNF